MSALISSVDDDDISVATQEMEDMEEIEVDMGNAPEDDDEDDGGEGEGIEEEEGQDAEDVEDMAFFTFRGHSDSVYCSAVHPTNTRIILTGGGDDKAYLWSLPGDDEGETSQMELTGHTDTVTKVGFNFDGTMCLTASYDGTIRVWDVKVENKSIACTLKHVLDGPEDIEWAQWHSVGNAIVAGSSDGTSWMWLANTGQCVQVLAGHDGGVTSGCFSNDGKMIITGGDDGTVRLWNPKSGACKHVFSGATMGHEAIVTCLASSANGELLLSGSGDGTLKLFQVSGKRMLQTMVHYLPNLIGQRQANIEDGGEGDMDMEETLAVECVGFSGEDYKWAASGGMDKYLKVWELTSGLCRCKCFHGDSVVALQWIGSYPVIATAALDMVLRIWDARNGSLLHSLTGHTNLITDLFVAPLNSTFREENHLTETHSVVTVSDDTTAKVFLIDVGSMVA